MPDDINRYSRAALEILRLCSWCPQHKTTKFFCEHRHSTGATKDVGNEVPAGDHGVAFHDSFDRVPINQKWAQWVGAPFYDRPPAVSPDRPGEVRFYAAGSKQEGPHIGVVIRHDTECSNCHEVVEAGHRYLAVPAADMAGTIHHIDCTDPTLQRTATPPPGGQQIPRVSEDDWFYLLRYPDHTVVQCAGNWDVANNHLRHLRREYEAEHLAATGRRPDSTIVLIGAYGPNRVGGPEGRGGVFSHGYTPTLIGSIDLPRDEWIPA